MVRFRRFSLTPSNSKIMRALQKTCLPYDSVFMEKKAWFWVGYYNGTPVAFCALAPSIRWSDCVYLARAGVVPEFRGQGLQKRMIELRERWARKQSYKWAVTDTTDNPASSNSLIARGYKLYEPTVTWGPSGALYWRKRL